MQIKIWLLILSIFASFNFAEAKKEKKDKASEMTLVDWANEQSSNEPSEINGVKIFRVNNLDSDGLARIAGFVDTPSVLPENAFTAAFIQVADNMDSELDEITTIDFDNKRFIIVRQMTLGEGKDAFTADYATAYQITDDLINFVSYDVIIEYKEKGLIPRKLPLEKFKPATNKRHAEILETFFRANSQTIEDIKEFVIKNPNIEITHWPEIKAGKVVKGMTPEEVKLIGGQPRSINESGKRVQWMFSNTFIVIFTDGLVTNVVQ